MNQLADELRQHDRELWLASLYTPAPLRPALTTLFALHSTLAAIPITTTEPMIGLIRLAWWREALEALDNAPPPDEPHLQAAHQRLLPAGLTGKDLATLEARPAARLDPELTEPESTAAEAAGGAHLFALAARLLNADPKTAAALGRTWATGEPLPNTKTPKPLRPLLGLARLGQRDAAATAAGRPRSPRATAGRQLRLLWAVATGR